MAHRSIGQEWLDFAVLSGSTSSLDDLSGGSTGTESQAFLGKFMPVRKVNQNGHRWRCSKAYLSDV